VHEHSRVELK
jgi:hypothetical protein